MEKVILNRLNYAESIRRSPTASLTHWVHFLTRWVIFDPLGSLACWVQFHPLGALDSLTQWATVPVHNVTHWVQLMLWHWVPVVHGMATGRMASRVQCSAESLHAREN
jgi:hypothetical protein